MTEKQPKATWWVSAHIRIEADRNVSEKFVHSLVREALADISTAEVDRIQTEAVR